MVTFFDPRGDNGVLANFRPSKALRARSGIRTYEHVYQAVKFVDRRVLARWIALAPGPAEAKARARALKDCRLTEVDGCKLDLMANIVAARAETDGPFRQALIAIGRRAIVEVARDDPFWGCWEGRGANWMGRLLAARRDRLRRGARRALAPVNGRMRTSERRYMRRAARWLTFMNVTP